MPNLVRSLLGASLVLAAASYALVLPGGAGQQQAFSIPAAVGHLVHDSADQAFDVLGDSWDILQGVTRDAVSGKMWTTLKHDALPSYTLRVTEPKLCDPDVKQYSGYLDTEDKHFFFWFFEARRKPAKAPTVLWLNGGPGCSSTTGLLFENGPCNIRANGTTERNPYSWNEEANMIYLDQPVGVGGSWADNSKINNTPQAAEDVFAFLSLFLARYKKYAANELHISGESYAGTYLPHIASVIHRESLALEELGEAAPLPRIRLASVLIGNGLSDPRIQFGQGVVEFMCNSPQAVFDPAGPECANLASKAATCARLIESCYKTGSRFACTPAGLYCWSNLYGDFQKLGLNPYDVRKKCDKEGEDGPLCYREMLWVEDYLNKPDIQAELGMREGLEFKSCNMEINQAFLLQGDGMHYAASLLTPLLADGIRVLFYAGVEDAMCSYTGIRALVEELDNVFKAEYNAAPVSPYVLLGGKKEVGLVKVAGAQGFTAGNLAFVSVNAAGHMVPTDAPDVALDLFARWIHNTPLVLSKPANAIAVAA